MMRTHFISGRRESMPHGLVEKMQIIHSVACTASVGGVDDDEDDEDEKDDVSIVLP
jgi:hypothetical protein